MRNSQVLLGITILGAALAGACSNDAGTKGGGGAGSSSSIAPATGGNTGASSNSVVTTAGRSGSGGIVTSGGNPGSGGVTVTGGATSVGGTTASSSIGSGGSAAPGGATDTGGATGGTTASGGARGGTTVAGGMTATGGMTAAGGSTGTQTGTPPGDISNASGVTVVAAHSMTRALFASYSGKLLQATRFSDKTTKDISVTSAGGTVDLTTLKAFCTSSTACGVSVLYDQTGNGNDLSQTLTAKMPTVAMDWTTKGGTTLPYSLSQASADDGGIPGGGGQFLRNRLNTKKIPTGSSPTTEYMVVYTKYYKGHCCWDYGNMEATRNDPEGPGNEGLGNDGPGTMFALYFGQTRDWTTGAGNGPWGMVDMEDGVYSGGEGNGGTNANDPAFVYPTTNIVGILAKTNGTSTFTLKVGDMEAATTFQTPYSGNLPGGYAPLRLEGGLSLGEGGDGSNNVDGAFFEGIVVAGQESDAADTSIATNLHNYFTK